MEGIDVYSDSVKLVIGEPNAEPNAFGRKNIGVSLLYTLYI